MSSKAYFDDAFKRANADQEQAVRFLSQIIPSEDKTQIRHQIENDPNFAGREHLSFGMNVRNALRAGGFFYDPHVMDSIWFSWLKEAVCLPENKKAITDSVRTRIKKYEKQQLLENPPPCPRISEERIAEIKRQLEDRYEIRMPEISVEYSENVRGSLAINPPPYDLDELDHVKAERNRDLRLRGLTEEEVSRIVSYRHTIFLLQKQPFQSLGLYGSAWHELAHVAATVIGIKDRVLNESFAIANEFRGLLQAVVKGVFALDEVRDLTEYLVKCARLEQVDTGLFASLSRMGLRGIPEDFRTPYHSQALEFIQRYNPKLEFRSRSPEDLITEWDNTIEYILTTWRKRKLKSQLPLIVVPSVVIGGFVAFIIIVSFVL
jgi:hypothetical protein